MAFTRKFLKALGIEEAAIEQIMDQHTEIVGRIQAELTDAKAKADHADELQRELDKSAGNADWKKKYDDIKREFDGYKTDQTRKESRQAKMTALSEIAKKAGISEKRIPAILKATDIDAYELGDDGKIKDADGATSYFTTEWSDFIAKPGTQGANTSTPPANSGTPKTKEEILKIKDRTERQAAIAENIQLFQEG